MTLRRARASSAARCAAVVLVLACSGDPASPEERVRAVLAAIETAAEARDVGALRAHVSEGYADPRGNDAQALARIATFHFMQNRSVHLLSRVRELEVTAPGEARAEALVAMAGAPIPGPEALPALRASLYRFEVRLREEDGEWRVASAEWQPAVADDFR